MDNDELRRMELPGYWALRGEEQGFGLWAGVWIAWAVVIAGLVVWHDQQWLMAAAFLALGAAVARFGWRALYVVDSIAHDWARKRWVAKDEEFALWELACHHEEQLAAGDVGEDEDWETLDSPAQKRWLQRETFVAFFTVPTLLACMWGAPIGSLFGASFALLPEAQLSVAAGAFVGLFTGAAAVTCIGAITLAVLPLPKEVSPRRWSFRQSFVLLVSPLFIIPALYEAIVLWTAWYFGRRRLS